MKQEIKTAARAGVLPGDGQLRCHCGSPAVLRSAEGLCRTHQAWCDGLCLFQISGL